MPQLLALGLLSLLLGFLLAGLLAVWLLVVVSLLATGAIFGWVLPIAIPIWIALLCVCLAFGLLTWPLRVLRRAARRAGPDRLEHPLVSAADAIAAFAIVAIVAWYGYHHWPELHGYIERIMHAGDRGNWI